MTSVCISGRIEKNGIGYEAENTDNSDFLPTSFLSVTYDENASEVSTCKNASFPAGSLSEDDVHFTILENDDNDNDDNHECYSENKFKERNKRLATFTASVREKRGDIELDKYQLKTEQPKYYSCTFFDKFSAEKHLRRPSRLHGSAGRNRTNTSGKEEEFQMDDPKVDTLKDSSQNYETDSLNSKNNSLNIKCKETTKTKEKKILSCHLCSKEFKFNSLLLHHIESHKPKSKTKKSLSCYTCGKKYTKSGSLTKHELQHEGKGSFRCRPCGEVFATEAERTKHRDEKHEKPWKCSICNHLFATEEKLESHVKWHESKETEVFVCNVCGKEFKLKVNLKVHVESRCGTDPQHVCKVCGKAFMTRGTLVTHSLLHTGEKTFLCRFCGKSFRLKVEMQRHERSHTGEKPFVCKVCNKAFAHRESLVTHNTIHTGIRPYMCEACGSTFSCIGNLIKHKKTHRNRCALVTPALNSSKPKVKSNLNQLKRNEKISTTRNKMLVDHSVNPLPFDIQRPNNIAASREIAPVVSGTCCTYRNSNYEENRDWMPQSFSTSEHTSERIAAVGDRFHPVGDHINSMDRNIKGSQYFWGSGNIMGLHPEAVQSLGVYTTVPKDIKPDSTSRSLPYSCATDGLLVSNGKPVLGSFFQHLDNHRLQTYGPEKYPHEYRIQNVVDHNTFSYSSKIATEIFQHNNFKSSDNLNSNIESNQKREGFEASSGCGNETEAVVTLPESHTTCNSIIDNENDRFVNHSFKVESSTNNAESETVENKCNSDLAGSIPENKMHETDDLSNLGSPLNCSDSELSESEQIDTSTSKVQIVCSESVKEQVEEGEKDDTPETEPVTKTQRERKQKYPVKCDVKDEHVEEITPPKIEAELSEIQVTCVFCGLHFAQEQLLNDHMQSHGEEKHKNLDTNREIEDMKVLCSDEDEPLDKRLERYLNKVESVNTDMVPKRFLCQYCNKYFDFVSQLNRHRKSHSAEEKEATPCRHCGKKYTNKACLLKHESQHTGTGVFKCRQCGDGFNSKQEYRSHRAKQHGKQWSCSECQRSFSNSSNLKNHYNNKHLGREAKSYACNICGKLFKQKGNLKVHVDSRCGSEPRHVCNICGKAFMSGGSLGTHLLLHTGEKTFLCRFCGKSYRLKVEMQRHERSHTGEKPFVCKVCNKAFAHRESLVTHNTIHTGIRPYMCEACGSTFSCIGNLIKHRQTHNRRCDIARV
ncbi:zinc finger protein 585A-like [Periplaneta americana]|uniref:zinc finger protein 585A-like n=1 Tax=Periplaneta americana TaxID=6978 RepID=UPI0037E7EF11